MSARSSLAGRIGAAITVGVIGLSVACGDASSECADGMTKVCMNDGATCACAPACSDKCDEWKVCYGNGRCDACKDASSRSIGVTACSCRSDLCVPSRWEPTDHVSFERNNRL